MPEFKEITENSTQIIGCISPETAYVVENYPYGFKLRTSIRYWIETKQGFGQRFCSQTLNPKTGLWNKPKCSTYSDAMALTKTESNGHVGFVSVGIIYAELRWGAEFASTYQLDAYQTARFAGIDKVLAKPQGE